MVNKTLFSQDQNTAFMVLMRIFFWRLRAGNFGQDGGKKHALFHSRIQSGRRKAQQAPLGNEKKSELKTIPLDKLGIKIQLYFNDCAFLRRGGFVQQVLYEITSCALWPYGFW